MAYPQQLTFLKQRWAHVSYHDTFEIENPNFGPSQCEILCFYHTNILRYNSIIHSLRFEKSYFFISHTTWNVH